MLCDKLGKPLEAGEDSIKVPPCTDLSVRCLRACTFINNTTLYVQVYRSFSRKMERGIVCKPNKKHSSMFDRNIQGGSHLCLQSRKMTV
eukprot:c29274_g1_i1 orf=266-532(-)